jgi:hypothetical protein
VFAMVISFYFAATLLAFWGYLVIFLQRYYGYAAFASMKVRFFPTTMILNSGKKAGFNRRIPENQQLKSNY